VTFTVAREGNTLRATCGAPAAAWSLAAGDREVQASPGTGRIALELG
jgi:alpha-D-xyloside xylohydrolase